VLAKKFSMKGDSDKDLRAKYAKDLEQFIAQRKYVFAPTSHDMTRVVKCVFGADRRRVSASQGRGVGC
jgi:hypothetical protein